MKQSEREEFIRKEKALLFEKQHNLANLLKNQPNEQTNETPQTSQSSERVHFERDLSKGKVIRGVSEESNLSILLGTNKKSTTFTQFPHIGQNQNTSEKHHNSINQSGPDNAQSLTKSLDSINLNFNSINKVKDTSHQTRKSNITNLSLKQQLQIDPQIQAASTSTDFFSSQKRIVLPNNPNNSTSSKTISFVSNTNPLSHKQGFKTLNSFQDHRKQFQHFRQPSRQSTTPYYDLSEETREMQRINNEFIRVIPTIKSQERLNTISNSGNNNNSANKETNPSFSRTQLPQHNQNPSSQTLNSLLDTSSPILSATKADIMNQLSKKTGENFYGKLIKQALQSEISIPPQSKEQSRLKQYQQQYQQQLQSSSQHLRMPYDTNISSIKSKLTISMLELLRSDLYGKTEDIEQPKPDDPAVVINSCDSPSDWKFKKVVFPSEEQFSQKFDAVQKEICEKRESNETLENKLFNLLQTKEPPITIHAAQNKDLSNFSERRDVVALAKWFQDMLGVLQKDNKKEEKGLNNNNNNNNSVQSFSNTIADLQAVHQACIAEIIRQVSQHCAERGQLLKHVWESLMILLSEIFNQQKAEISLFQKSALKEISSVQAECTKKIDYYLPLISQLQSDIHKKEALNERIVLEFKYLKNKNSKLEKLLSEAKTEHKHFKEDYNHLAKQLDEHKLLNARTINKHEEEKQKLTTKFVDQLDQITLLSQRRQEQFSEKLRLEMDELRILNNTFDTRERQIDQDFSLKQADVDEIEEKAQKKAFYLYPQQNQKIIEEEERDYYGENQRNTSHRSNDLDINNMEIEGTDGVKLVLTSVAVQVEEEDLIRKKTIGTDTSSLYDMINMAVQAVQDISEKTVQTPKEWMTRFQEISSSDSEDNSESEDEMNTSLVMHMKDKERKKKEKMINVADQLVDTPLHKYIQALGQKSTVDIHHDSADVIMIPRAMNGNSINEKNQQVAQISINNNSSNGIQELPVKNSGRKLEQRPTVVLVKAANQTLESTLGSEIEKEVGDLKLLQNSKMKFVQEVLEKILKFDLLKDNPHLSSRTLLQFLEDSLAFQQEENQRLKSIRAQCKNNIIQNVKQKLDISEKLAEIEETKKNLDLGNGMYCKLKADYFKVVQQLHGGGGQDKQQSTGVQKNNNENNGANKPRASSTMASMPICITDDSDEDSSGNEDIRDEDNNIIYLSNTSISGAIKESESLSQTKKLQTSSSQSLITPFKPTASQQVAQTQAARPSTQKQQDFQRSNRRLASVVESVVKKQQKRLSQAPAFSSTNLYGDSQSGSRVSNGESFVSQQIIYQKKQIIDILQNERYTKLNLKKDFRNQSSLNAEAACNFFHTAGMKILANRLRKDKGVLFTEGNTRRYIAMVYGEKMKQLRQGDRSNPLYSVTYEFFLKKFGFKKMAEKNLKQFLRSLQYHYQQEKTKTFLRFYGIDHAITYDDDDFNFYIECLINLEDNSNNLPIYDQMNLFPINKLLEILFKAFDNGKVSVRVLNRIRSEIESMRYVSAEPALRNKNLIDQDLGLECLLSAKFEEKKNDFLAMRPVYLAGDVDRNEVIGYDEFLMLGRNIHKNVTQIQLSQLYSQNTDLIDDITGEKTMSFQQFTVISVKNGLFKSERTSNYVDAVDNWDEIKNLQILRQYWMQKKDVIRLRLVKAGAYRNFYRLMVKHVDEFFQEQDKLEEDQDRQKWKQQQQLNNSAEGELSGGSKTSIKMHINNNNTNNRSVSPQSQGSMNGIQFGSSKQIPNVLKGPVKMAEKEATEKQAIVWLIYRLLDDESKSVILQSNVNALIPIELTFFDGVLLQLAQNNKLGMIYPNCNNNNTNNSLTKDNNNNIATNNDSNNNNGNNQNNSSITNISVSSKLIPI